MKKRRGPFWWANVVMLVVFLLSVGVQYNDPDAPVWMAMYGAAALACLLFLLGRMHWGFPALIGLVALIWAGFLAPGVIGRVSVGELFDSMQMKTIVVEHGREMGGLLITAAWMTALAAVGRHRAGRAQAPGAPYAASES
jgi:hypothetical protein